MWRVLILIASLAQSANGYALGEARSEDGDYSIELIGNGSFLGAYLRFPDVPLFYPRADDGLITSTFRLIAEGVFAEKIAYEVNFFAGMSRIPEGPLGGAFDSASNIRSPYRYPYLEWDYLDSGATGGALGLDRFKLSYSGEIIVVDVGRIPINYSVTSVFTPNDFFAPFSPTAVNTLYKPGADAIRIGATLGMNSSVTALGVMGYGDGDTPSWGKSAVLFRGATVLGGFEWSLLGGKIAERWIGGGALQGELGSLGVRSEGHVGFPDKNGNGLLEDRNRNRKEDDVYVRVASGVDKMFEWQNATLGAEYMFVSDGSLEAEYYLVRAGALYPDDLFYLGRHYLGASASCDVVPILRAGAVGIVNLTDGSGLAALTLSYNLSDESDLIAGAMVPWGKTPSGNVPGVDGMPALRSEFGIMPNMFFLETRFYF